VNEVYHTPVLLKDCIDALQIVPKGIYVDVTFGGGGHSKEILKKLTTGKLYGFDCDKDAERNSISNKHFTLVPENFRNLKDALAERKVTKIDGLLADLGVSSHQFDSAERGFSTRFDADLDMRMNKKSGVSAVDLIQTYSEKELKRIFWEYGEIRNAPQVARKIVANRGRLTTVNALKSALESCATPGKENQFFAKVFQALRIEVNDELNSLKELLIQSKDVLKPGGRIVVIAYHSLEDRLVKNFFRSGKFEGDAEKDVFGNVLAPFKVITRKPILPSAEEVERNNRARSAKLRVAERVNNK